MANDFVSGGFCMCWSIQVRNEYFLMVAEVCDMLNILQTNNKQSSVKYLLYHHLENRMLIPRVL